MQEKRDYERNAGTGEIREAEILEVNEADREEALFQQEYRATIANISLDAETFTHPNAALQVLAAKRNQEAEQTLNLVHTSESMLRAKEALSNLPPGAGDDEDSESDSEDDSLPNWLMSKEFLNRDASIEIAKMHQKVVNAQASTSLFVEEMNNRYLGTLKLHKSLINQMARDKEELLHSVSLTERRLLKDLADRIPFTERRSETAALDKLNKRVDKLELVMGRVVANQEAILAGQRHQNELMEKLLKLDFLNPADNKKGEKILQDQRTSIL